MFIPRGIRNNNPLNIRVGNSWIGEVENPTDKDFEQFESMFYGLRAGFVILKRYICRYGLDNITEIISRWAPASENNTRHYIHMVARLSGVGALDTIKWTEGDKICHIVSAMIFVECGQEIPLDEISRAYDAVRNLNV